MVDRAENAGNELAKREARLTEIEERIRVLIDHAPEAITVLDAKSGRFVDVNPMALELFEASRDELLKVGPEDVSPPFQPDGRPSSDVAPKYVADALAGGTPVFEWTHRTLTGKDVECEVRLVRLPSATQLLVRGSILDIGDRKRAENALKETSQRLEDAQRIARMGSWELDIPSGKVIWSNQLFNILEFDPAEVEPSFENYFLRLHPDDAERVRQAYAKALKTGKPYRMTRRLLLPGKRIKWVSTHCEIVFDEDGEPLLSRGTLQDITEQKLTEDALHLSEATLATFLKVAPEAVIVTDDSLNVTEFSGGAEAIFGYKSAEVIGQSIDMLIPERFHAAHRKYVKEFRRSRETSINMNARAQITGLRKNGEEFPAAASLSKLDTPTGLSFALILRDVSEQVASQETLLSTMREAEAASEAKSRFIANMSHELRTPLNAIIGFSELLANNTGSVSLEKQAEYAKDIHDSGRHLLSIINDILEISRLDLGSTKLAEAETDLAEVIAESLRMTRLRASEGGVTLREEPMKHLPHVNADRRLLVQALLNLLSNAVKFTKRGGEVCVGAEQQPDGGISLYVRDTGIGMSASDIARIGEPFMQVDSSLARRYEGTGLGLTIAKRLAELHGGELSISSSPGEGTTARIILPAARLVMMLVPQADR